MKERYWVYTMPAGKWVPVASSDTYDEALLAARRIALDGTRVRVIASHEGLLFEANAPKPAKTLEQRFALGRISLDN